MQMGLDEVDSDEYRRDADDTNRESESDTHESVDDDGDAADQSGDGDEAQGTQGGAGVAVRAAVPSHQSRGLRAAGNLQQQFSNRVRPVLCSGC